MAIVEEVYEISFLLDIAHCHQYLLADFYLRTYRKKYNPTIARSRSAFYLYTRSFVN